MASYLPRLDDRKIAEPYSGPWVLIRPNQHVAWWGTMASEDPSALVDILCTAGEAALDPRLRLPPRKLRGASTPLRREISRA
jgi:hypothetical protein